jgi:AbrB family looped-hinge helix DNA binding protein
MQRVKVSRKNQIAVPSEVRKKLGIQAGDVLTVDIRDGEIVLRKDPESWADRFYGLHKEIWEGIDPMEYIRQERASWDE